MSLASLLNGRVDIKDCIFIDHLWVHSLNLGDASQKRTRQINTHTTYYGSVYTKSVDAPTIYLPLRMAGLLLHNVRAAGPICLCNDGDPFC